MERMERSPAQLPCVDGSAEVNMASNSLSRKVTGLKAKVLELANSVAGPWGEEIIEAATQNKVASKSSSESVKCQSLLESLKNGFLAEIKAMEQDFKLQVNMQKGENVRFKQLLTDIRSEKTSIHQQLLLFQRRVERLENEIGQD